MPAASGWTSLATIGLSVVFGAAAFGIVGDIVWLAAAIVGLPAVAGVLAGVWLQQRASARAFVGPSVRSRACSSLRGTARLVGQVAHDGRAPGDDEI